MQYVVVDAFADGPLSGNPAAVVLAFAGEACDDAMRQAIAAEFNLSETAFVTPREAGGFELRWFTPTVEVALCGHATLAAARAVQDAGLCSAPAVVFHTRRSGTLTCTFAGERIRMDFPATPPAPPESAPLPDDAAAVLGVAGPVTCVGTTAMNLTLLLPDAAQVRAARPDLAVLAAWHDVGVTITASSDDARYDLVNRFFAPRAGIAEDPVTGSAYCALGPYWSAKLGKRDLVGRQVSRRGGTVHVGVRGDRVELGGDAIVVMRGTLHV